MRGLHSCVQGRTWGEYKDVSRSVKGGCPRPLLPFCRKHRLSLLIASLLRISASRDGMPSAPSAANLPAKILDFRGFDSSRVLILRGGILMSIGDFPEI